MEVQREAGYFLSRSPMKFGVTAGAESRLVRWTNLRSPSVHFSHFFCPSTGFLLKRMDLAKLDRVPGTQGPKTLPDGYRRSPSGNNTGIKRYSEKAESWTANPPFGKWTIGIGDPRNPSALFHFSTRFNLLLGGV